MAMDEFVPADWLYGVVDITEIEAEWLDKPGPYGVSAHAWRELVAKMRPGDEIRAFSSPAQWWRDLAGQAGYALVRGRVAVDGVVTMMN